MRPGGLTAVCVIAFVLAALGLLTMLCGGIGLVSQQFMGEMMSSMPGPPGPAGQQFQTQMDAQAQMYKEMAAMQQRHLPLIIAQYVLHFVVIVLLIAGGIRALQGKRNGQRLVVISMVSLIVFALFRLYPQWVIQAETQEITMKFTNQIMQSTPGAGGPTAGMMKSMMDMSTAFGMAIWGVWMLALLSYAGTSIWYIKQPQVEAWFAGSSALEIENFTEEDDAAAEPSEPNGVDEA